MQIFFDNLMQFLNSGSVWVYVFIFVGKIAEVAVSTLRIMLIGRGERISGVIASILEYTLWIFVTASAITNFQDDPLKVIVLIIAFGAGNFIGSWLEEKLAFGLCTLSIITSEQEATSTMAKALRAEGYAVTVMDAEGIHNQKRAVLSLTVRRKLTNDVLKLINKTNPHVMVTIANTASVKGGFLKDTIRKHTGLPPFLTKKHIATPPHKEEDNQTEHNDTP